MKYITIYIIIITLIFGGFVAYLGYRTMQTVTDRLEQVFTY